jgi:hypothetical protein
LIIAIQINIRYSKKVKFTQFAIMHKKLKLVGAVLVGSFALTACSFLPVSELNGEENQREFLKKVETFYGSWESIDLNLQATGDVPIPESDGEAVYNYDFQVDGELSQTTLSAGDASFSILNASDSTYVGDGDEWFKVDGSLVEGFELLTKEDIESPFEESADDIEFTYNGLVDCDDASGGKCHEFVLQEGDFENTYAIDPREYYIYRQKSVSDDGEEATLTLKYGDVSLSEPDNLEELSEVDAVSKIEELLIIFYEAAGVL